MMDSSVLDESREPLKLPAFEKAVMQSVTRALEVWRDEAMDGGPPSPAHHALMSILMLSWCSLTLGALAEQRPGSLSHSHCIPGFCQCSCAVCSGKDYSKHGAELCDGSLLPAPNS